jgi:ATP adenylyltransferase/5',5'''-P-1,P-4-tetraphosphate phosphorylase II
MNLQQQTDVLISSQISGWDLAATNYAGLSSVITRTIHFDGFDFLVQFNPARIRSSAAKVDAKSIGERPCFLCSHHLPPQQKSVDFGNDYMILVNPFPIFSRHLTIPKRSHTDQLIEGSFADMLELSEKLDSFVLFYNGPKCGASAPDHFHFQAGNRGFMPVEADFEVKKKCSIVKEHEGVKIYSWHNYLRSALTLESVQKDSLAGCFDSIYNAFKAIQPKETEPMLNILSYFDKGRYVVHLFPRKLHRPSQYFAQGSEQILISPASVDMGGVLITPRQEDFEKITGDDVRSIFSQVCLSQQDAERLIANL